MKAREQFYQADELARIRAEIRRSQRMECVWTWLAVIVLIGLVVLCGWLVALVYDGAFQMRTGVSALPLMPLAMAPITKGAIGAAFLLFSIAGCVLAVRRIRDDEAFYSTLRREEDVFAALREPGLPVPPEDAQRILVACAAESWEIQRLVKHALTTLDIEDGEDALEVAHDRLTTLVACVEALCERLGDGPRNGTKTGGAEAIPTYAELADVMLESAAYMRGESSWEEAGRVSRIIREAAARLEGGSEA